MYMLIDIFANLTEILRNKVRFYVLLKYYYLSLPIIFVQVTPIVILLATVYVFSDMNKHNEITAMKSSGVSIAKIVRPFLLVGFFASLFVMLINEMVVPQATINSTKMRQAYIERIKGSPEKNTVLNDVAIYGEGNKLYYVKEFNVAKRQLNEIIILDHDAANDLTSKIVAKSGRWENHNWVFYNCIVYHLRRNGELLGKPLIYPKKVMDIKETPKDFYQSQFRTELMNFSQLLEYVKKFYRVDKKIARRLAVDLYNKTSFPFTSFIVVLLGVSFGLTSRHGGAMWGIGVCIALGFSYYAVMAITLALGKGGWIPPLLAAWGANLLFLGAGIVLLKRLAN